MPKRLRTLQHYAGDKLLKTGEGGYNLEAGFGKQDGNGG